MNISESAIFITRKAGFIGFYLLINVFPKHPNDKNKKNIK